MLEGGESEKMSALHVAPVVAAHDLLDGTPAYTVAPSYRRLCQRALGEQRPDLADGLWGELRSRAAPHVLAWVDRLKVLGVDATARAPERGAEVIEFSVRRNRAAMALEVEAVGEKPPSGLSLCKGAVPKGIDVALPDPARRFVPAIFDEVIGSADRPRVCMPSDESDGLAASRT